MPTTQIWNSCQGAGNRPHSGSTSPSVIRPPTKVVDGQESPLSIVKLGKLYEVQK